MTRWDIINFLIRKNNYKSYLEIGYFKGWSFDNVKCGIKVAVDPFPSKTEILQSLPKGEYIGEPFGHSEGGADTLYKMTSDEYFENYASPYIFDIIFIDGLHEASQVERDIKNSLDHLSPGGTIVLHDCNPPTLAHATTGDNAGNWNGDVYKAFIKARTELPFLTYTIDTDWGCGVIHPDIPAEPLNFPVEEIDYSILEDNRVEALNLISVEEFIKKNHEEPKDNNVPA